MKKLAVALFSLPLIAFSGAALAGDHGAGADKADVCLDCHMPDDFAGASADEIEAKIRALIAGDVSHPVDVEEDLAEEDIAPVAAWFAHEGAK